MKKPVRTVLALTVVALAASFVPAVANPDPPPNDNVCICHQTQWKKLDEGEANDNQKVVVICVDPHSNVIPAHEKHGDFIASSPEECQIQD